MPRPLIIAPPACAMACLAGPLRESAFRVVVIDDQHEPPRPDPKVIAETLAHAAFRMQALAREEYCADLTITTSDVPRKPVKHIAFHRGRPNAPQPFYRSLRRYARRT